MSRTEQNAALIVCLAGVMKRLDEMARGIGAGPARSLTGNTQVSLMSHEDQVKTHVYTAPFKVWVSHWVTKHHLERPNAYDPCVCRCSSGT
jgi:hypothetical protein